MYIARKEGCQRIFYRVFCAIKDIVRILRCAENKRCFRIKTVLKLMAIIGIFLFLDFYNLGGICKAAFSRFRKTELPKVFGFVFKFRKKLCGFGSFGKIRKGRRNRKFTYNKKTISRIFRSIIDKGNIPLAII